MAIGEKRFPRDVFTKKLRRLCERLDECHERSISFKHWYFSDRELTSVVTVKSLWVAGSYARGALDCGDLDVLVQVVATSDLPRTSTLIKAFFSTLPYVRYYVGDPTKNSSGIEFPGAVLIWSGRGCAWRAAIDAIAPDANAGRHARKADAIPLRREQLHAELDDLDEAVELQAQGVLEWEFVEITSAMLAPIAHDKGAADEEYLLRCASMWGKSSQRLVPAAIRLMREREPFGIWRDAHSSRNAIRCGSTELRIGRLSLPIHRLDGDPAVRQLALAPHISSKGPNGFWLIRRGPNHPDHLALQDRCAYYLTMDGSPSIIDSTELNDRSALLLELFTTRARAAKEAKEWNKYADEGDVLLEVAQASSADLLTLTGLSDVVDIDGTKFPVTWTGELYIDRAKPQATVEEIASNLLKQESPG